MSTAETVKAQLQADITAANGVTGKQDSTVHDAVTSLIAGFGDGSVVISSIFKDLGSNVWTLTGDVTSGSAALGFNLDTVADFIKTHVSGILVVHTKYLDENIGGDWIIEGVSASLVHLQTTEPKFIPGYVSRTMSNTLKTNTLYGLGAYISVDGRVSVQMSSYSASLCPFKAGSYKTSVYGIEV